MQNGNEGFRHGLITAVIMTIIVVLLDWITNKDERENG